MLVLLCLLSCRQDFAFAAPMPLQMIINNDSIPCARFLLGGWVHGLNATFCLCMYCCYCATIWSDFCPKGSFGVAVIMVRHVILSKYRASNHIQ